MFKPLSFMLFMPMAATIAKSRPTVRLLWATRGASRADGAMVVVCRFWLCGSLRLWETS